MSTFLNIVEVLVRAFEVICLLSLVVGLMSVSTRVRNIETVLTLILTLNQQTKENEPDE
jgi:formylmethanofuran dehydrogenase subunit B